MQRFVGRSAIILCVFFVGMLASATRGQEPMLFRGEIGSRAIAWFDDLDSGWRESRRTGRPMVIFITSPRCRYCDAMKVSTWKDLGIKSRLDSEFIAVQLSPDRNAKELSRIHVDVYPTTIVALPQGKVIDHRKGYQPPDLMHGLLNRVTRR